MNKTETEKVEIKDRRNSIAINDQLRGAQILIYDNGPDSMEKAIGTLEIAKDMMKAKIAEWHAREANRKGILVPSGKDRLSVH